VDKEEDEEESGWAWESSDWVAATSSSVADDEEKVRGGSRRLRGLKGGPIRRIWSSGATCVADASRCLRSITLQGKGGKRVSVCAEEKCRLMLKRMTRGERDKVCTCVAGYGGIEVNVKKMPDPNCSDED
jgi:hypothetical protein